MQGIQQIKSANEEAARNARAAYKARLLAEGKTTVCKLDALGAIDIDIQPLAFDTPEAARGHLTKSVALHLHSSYLISTPTKA